LAEESLPPQEKGLEQQATLEKIIEEALTQSPELREAAARARRAREEAPVAGALPDMELRYQLWDAPFSNPLGMGAHMVGVGQTFPAPGSLAAKTRAGTESARIADESRRAAAEELVTRVRRAFYDYQRASRQIDIQLEHRVIAERFLELARGRYQAGKASQQDVLRAGVELRRLDTDLAALEQSRSSARALLNTLMGRDAEAPLGPPEAVEAPREEPAIEQLANSIDSNRPEIAAADHAVARSEASLRAASREAKLPSIMLGAEYMAMPMAEEPNAFGAMVSITLPWLNPSHRHEVKAAEEALLADRQSGRSVRLAARFQLADAAARYRAARRSFEAIEQELLPLARRSFEAAEAGFASGGTSALEVLDAERSFLAVRLDRERALAELLTSRAELLRAAGMAAPRGLES
jgi:outer membrane protein TolC